MSSYETELSNVIAYIFIAFLLMGGILILFFYFSRKKIIKQELEKKDLEIHYQKELLRAVIITQEEERKRIAQDLHDDISSKLNIVSLNSHLLTTPNLKESEINEITHNIIDLTTKALENSKRIAHDLLPPVLEKFGLNAAIEELVLELNNSKSVKVSYQSQIKFKIEEEDKNLHVFRILQELMNNSVRHGKAKHITISFSEIKNEKICDYSDDGIGFEVDELKNKSGLGMKNIESRIAFINGSMGIDSQKNKGTHFILKF